MSSRRGFSLIEILVALFVMSMVVVFSSVVNSTIKVTRDSTYENVAFRIADSKLGELRAAGYTSLPVSGPFLADELSTIPEGAASTSVVSVNAKIKQITTGVSWRGADGLPRYVSLTTLMTQSGGL